MDYLSYLALSTQTTKLNTTPSSCRLRWKKWRTPSTFAPLKPLLSMRVEDPVDEELDPRSRLREYVDSKRKLVAKKLCYAKPTRSSWPLKQGRKGDLSQLKEDLEQKITTWQREVDLKLMKSVWGAHVRTPEKDDLSEECVCEPPKACLCCHRPPEMVEQDPSVCLPRAEGCYRGRRVGGGPPPRRLFKGQATYTPTRTWRTRSRYWTRGYKS